MINEILVYKEIKRLKKYGIPRNKARKIIEDVIEILGHDTNQDNIEKAVNYAISLTYMINFPKISWQKMNYFV